MKRILALALLAAATLAHADTDVVIATMMPDGRMCMQPATLSQGVVYPVRGLPAMCGSPRPAQSPRRAKPAPSMFDKEIAEAAGRPASSPFDKAFAPR
jgi:hypothetical protein